MMHLAFSRWSKLRNQGPVTMPIGVDFAQEALYMVQYEHTETGPRISAAATLPYAGTREELVVDKKAVRKLVKKALASAPFKGRRVHTSLPASEVRIVPLSLPMSAAQSEQAAVIKALREKLRSDLSNEIVDYLQVRSNTVAASEFNVLAAVATRDAVLKHLRMIEHGGMEPVSLDVGPAALARLLGNMQPEDHEKSLLLINFGMERSYITVVWGQRLMLDREVQFGQSPLLSKLADALGVDGRIAESLLQNPAANADFTHANLAGGASDTILDEILYPQFSILAEEVSRTLVYIASKTRGSSTRSIYLNGSLASYPYIQKKMHQLFDVPVSLLDPLSQFDTAEPKSRGLAAHHKGGFALAAGLALRA